MNHYFPGLIDTPSIPHSTSYTYKYNVNSGENAIRLLLKSYNLPSDAKVAIPYYVCDSLKQSVIKEGFQPLYLDIKGKTYWTSYDMNFISEQNARVVILVHFYGFIHPDTKQVTQYCKQNDIYLIHDMAQSHGVNEADLTYGDIVYSFGAGKSTTAAGGGIIKSIDESFYKNHIHNPPFASNTRALLFMKSRIYSYSFSPYEKLLNCILNRLPKSNLICRMTPAQQDAAEYVMSLVKKKQHERNMRYKLLAAPLKDHTVLSIPYDNPNALNFKCVIFTHSDTNRLKKHLKEKEIPFFCLFDSITVGRQNANRHPNFEKNGAHFIELSSEASVPIDEIIRIADAIKVFR